MKAFRITTIALSVAAALLGQPAQAVLERVGPINPAPTHAGLPSWYQDTTGLALEFCAPTNQAEVDAGLCLVGPAEVPNFPEFFPGNFFDEHFYYDASTLLTPATGGRIVLVMAVEANAAVPGDQVVFSRIRTRFDGVPVTGKYRFIHPYGDETFDGVAGDRIFVTDDFGLVTGVFDQLLQSRLGPFLVPSDTPGGAQLPPYSDPTVPGKLYLADPGRSGPVTGSQATNPNEPLLAPGTFIPRSSTDPTATASAVRSQNIFRVEGPLGSNIGGPGIDFIETVDFGLIGRIYTGPIAGRVDVNRASYTRNATAQKLDVFATGSPTTQGRIPPQPRPAPVVPSLTFFDAPCATALDADGNPVPPYSAPASANETSMLNDPANQIYWAQVAPAAIPTAVCVKDNNARDALGNIVPAYIPRNVADVVTITQAAYDPIGKTLTVNASSSDETVPPVLTLGYGITGAATLAAGQVIVPNVLVAPDKVRVASAAHGRGEYTVATGSVSPPPATVVAGNDSQTIGEDSGAVLISVLGNDTLPPGATSTLAIFTNASKGVATVAGSQISYTPNLNANGADSFTYRVTAGGVTSNIATVTVNITPVNDAPSAANDAAIAGTGVPLVINVLANDNDVEGSALSIAAGSVSAVSPADGSSVQVTATNGLRFTGVGAGPYTFTYRASDGSLPSNQATVTVTMSLIEQLTASPVDYVASKNRWKVGGTTNITSAHALTLELAGPASCDGRVMGTTTSTGTTFLFDILNATGDLNPRTTACTQIRVRSALGGVTQPTTIRIK